MARLASESKGGYYPTPEKEMELAVSKITVKPNSSVTLLDPCAGDGKALKLFADYLIRQDAKPVTYGVELEDSRAEAAQTNLDHVLKSGYESLRMTHKSVSCMYLNPPYDWVEQGLSHERAERAFLRDLTAPGKYLTPGGLLMFCIPQHVLKDCASLLAMRFENIAVYRFTDGNYPVFKQVMVYGYRRKIKPGPEAQETKKWLQHIAECGPEVLPPLDHDDGTTYMLVEPEKKVELFRGSVLAPEEVARDIDNSPVWELVEDLLLPPSSKNTVELKPFVLPPKLMHIGVCIAAGAVGGNMGGHLLVGTTKKVIERTESYDEDSGTETIVETQKHVTTCRVFTPDGVFTLE